MTSSSLSEFRKHFPATSKGIFTDVAQRGLIPTPVHDSITDYLTSRTDLSWNKEEAFNMFDTMLANMRKTVTLLLMNIQIEKTPKTQETRSKNLNYESNKSETITNKKVGRNAPCPCGSGKKYKHCHGKIS